MRRSRRARRFECEGLEARDCPSRGLVPVAFLPAVTPTPRTDQASLNDEVKYANEVLAGPANVVFFGDSITGNFEYQDGKAAWDAMIAPLGAEAFGVSGDQTSNLLWRLDNGELLNPPRVAVVEIGTNNMGSPGGYQPASEVAAGIKAIVQTIRAEAPNTKILLLGVVPGGNADNPVRAKEAAVNRTISRLANGNDVVYFDPDKVLEDSQQSIAANYESNLVHLNPTGYALLAEAIDPILQRMLAEPESAGRAR